MKTWQLFSNHPRQQIKVAQPNLPKVGRENNANKIENKQLGKKSSSGIRKKQENKESETINILKKQIKNIKNEVVKLIQQGFINTSTPLELLESSGNMSSLSKSSMFSEMKTSDIYGLPDSCIRKKDSQCNSFIVSYQQTIKLREQCERLHAAFLKKQNQQTQLQQKCSQLQKQVNALRRCKQSLTQCIQVLQSSLRKTNEQIKYYLKHIQRLEAEAQSNMHEKMTRQNQYSAICCIKQRLEEEIGYRKAENNQLLKIIQIKEIEVEQLKFSFSYQVQEMEAQYKQATQKLSLRQQKIQTKSNEFNIEQVSQLQYQIEGLRNQLKNREKIMTMMLNDIRTMDKELLSFDKQHQQLLRCRELINSLNEQILRFNLNKLGFKYRYCF